MIMERYNLAVDRIKEIPNDKNTAEKYRPYFEKTAKFVIMIDELRQQIESGDYAKLPLEEKQAWNKRLYEDILPEQYDTSYGNPKFAVDHMGKDNGQILSFLYTELRGAIVYTFEKKVEYLTILFELFIEIYNCFEDETEPTLKDLKEIIYWYASDYCDVFVADRVMDQLNPDRDFAADIIKNADLSDLSYLYDFGEYIGRNEWETAKHLNALDEATIRRMADVYTEGYRVGFITTGKDLSIKEVVNIRYVLGFERVVRIAMENFEHMGLKPVLYRASVSTLTKNQHNKVGYYGGIANKQYEYDHRNDQGLFLNKKFAERKLEVMKHTYEVNKELASLFAGPAVMEVFGEKPFSPEAKEEAVSLTEKQEEVARFFQSKAGQMVNEYIHGDERSFTIIAYPVPEIGEKYEEIFDEVIRINTLDSEVYKNVQQKLIDALDEGQRVHIKGKAPNRTDLTVELYKLNDPAKETIFENCVADVNIPVGEVFTSPVLEGTNGKLHVSKVYLNELQYLDLEIDFKDGMIDTYRCGNFEDEEEGKKYIFENVLHNHPTLPMGECAIGTNTTAYVVAKKYGIEDKMPILIAEKMGPHFAVGDTCYSWCEDIKVYNPDGKEIVARDNSVSILRKEDFQKAYFNCHTDITIPYEELESIAVVKADGEETLLIKDGRFVLPGTEILNDSLKELSTIN